MRYEYDDGGRAEAGFSGKTGDCVTRSISIAANLPYIDVYNRLNELAQSERTGKRKRGKSNARTGSYKRTIHELLTELGWTFTPTMHIGSGCTVHLTDGELPMGRLIVSLSRHYSAVIDGVIHDTFNHERNVHCSDFINGSWTHRIQRRCVYGYWRKA